MAQEEQMVELYDFLYKDSNRLNSYYAQIFQGRLSSLEELDQEKHTTEKNLEGNIHIAKGGAKTISETQSSAKRVIDPHDIVTTDVLSYLVENQFVHKDFIQAPNNSLVQVNGTLLFLDKNLINITVKSALYIKDNPELIGQIPGFTEPLKPEAVMGLEAVQNMVNDGFFHPIFYIQSENSLITGTVKEEGLEEPVSTYILKYGGEGLENIYCIGVKETSNYLKDELIPQYLTETEEFKDNISQTICGESIKITPLAIFRKIVNKQKPKTFFGSASRKNQQ